MTGNEAIQYIHSMVWDRSATGYEHARELLKRMGNPEKSLKFVHIGGTNGKGSIAAMLASVLQQAGYKTGLYTSPYIFRFHERIQINGEQISDEDLGKVTASVKEIVEREQLSPSEFALVCCVAFAYFAQQECDIVVLEVGMGGANDSTNVIACPEAAVLTNIGLDHTEFLGNTLEEIAKTKAGILKEGGRAVFYPNTPSVEQVLQQICQERGISSVIPDFGEIRLRQHNLEGQIFDYGKRSGIFLPLLGNHQLRNAVVALETIDILREKGWKIEEEAIYDGLRKVTWPGRFEVLSTKPAFIVDGGHNPQCVEALAGNIQRDLSAKKIVALTGVLADKDYETMYQPILPYISEFVCITPPSPRSFSAKMLAEFLQKKGKQALACEKIEEAVKVSLERAGKDGAVVCFGSLYSIADIKDAFANY